MFSHREQPDLYHGRLSQTVHLHRHSRTRYRLGVRIEESWPNLMAVSMVGGRVSTQNDSTMTREELRSPNPWLPRAALRSSQEIYRLDTAFVLVDGTEITGHVSLGRAVLTRTPVCTGYFLRNVLKTGPLRVRGDHITHPKDEAALAAIPVEHVIDEPAAIFRAGTTRAEEGGRNSSPNRNSVIQGGAYLFEPATRHRVGAHRVRDVESGFQVKSSSLRFSPSVGHIRYLPFRCNSSA